MTRGDFFKNVYRLVRRVPSGKIATYGQIALRLRSGQARKITPRMVGWALHANRDPNVPCHRVVDRNGRLAPNFAFNGWREQKNRLISEGVLFTDEMHVDLSKQLWEKK